MADPRVRWRATVDDQTKAPLAKIKNRFKSAVSPTAIVAAASAAGTALGLLTIQASRTVREINNLSISANTSVRTLSSSIPAAKSLGFEIDKLGDIYKDVSDKIGDFIQTGAGPLRDFFDGVGRQAGVTAEQFRNLSGPDALQLYVKTLEEANVSQNEMTFFLEAIANDASRLLPLFKNNAAALREFQSEADRLGITLDQELVEKGRSLQSSLGQITQAVAGVGNALLNTLGPSLANAAKRLADVIVGARRAAEALGLLRAVDDRDRLVQIQKELIDLDVRQARTQSRRGQASRNNAKKLREIDIERNALLTEREQILTRIQQAENLKSSGESDGGAAGGVGGAASTVVGVEAAEAGQKQLETVRRQLLTEEEMIVESYQRRRDIILENTAETDELRQELLDKNNNEYLRKIQELETRRSNLEKRFAGARQKFDAATAKKKTSIVLAELRNLTAGVATSNKTLFRINKIAAIAEATIGAFQGAARTMGAYPYPLNVALAGLSLAAGLAQVQSIRSTSFSGGGTGSTPSAVGTAPTLNDVPVTPAGANIDLTEQRSNNVIEITFNPGISDSQSVRDFVENDLAEAIRDGVGLGVDVVTR